LLTFEEEQAVLNLIALGPRILRISKKIDLYTELNALKKEEKQQILEIPQS